MYVRLTTLGPEHVDATHAWLCEPDVWENLGLRTRATLERTREFIEGTKGCASVAPLGIIADGRHVGNVVLDSMDTHTSKARLYIYVGREELRGRGVGRQAVALALAHAFDVLGLNKVWLTVHARNARAIGAYEAEGFVVEGTLRDEFILRGERIDAFYMGVLRADFDARRATPAKCA